MKRLSFYSFLCAVLLMSVNVFGQFAGGNGTPEDPYQVNDASQFNAIANSNAYFVQIADITFENNTDFPQINFGGNYDGQGYKIKAKGDKTQPLFGTVTGTITEVVVEMVKTETAILCNTLNGGTISYCNIKGEVAEATAGAKAGGIVNTMNSGLVEYCCFQGKVKAKGAGAYAGGICAMQNGGEIKGSMVASGSELKADNGATVSRIANGSNSSQVTSCYCQVNPSGNGTKNAIAPSGVTITNSYPRATGGTLSGQALANYLNNGLDPEAFVVDGNKVVSVASSLSPFNNASGIYRSRKDGDFHKATTWTYEAAPNTRQFIISAGRKVTLKNQGISYISGASIIVEDGGKFVNEVQGDISGANITVRDGGNFINKKNGNVTATMEKNITGGQWNFIGFPVQNETNDGYGVAPLAEVEGDIWALRYDYSSNSWDNNYLHWYEGSRDYVKAGNGIFAYPDTNYTLSIYGTLNNNNEDLTVTNTITASGNGRWMALANPYPAGIEIKKLRDKAQGHVVYLYNGATFYTENEGTIKAGQGFFVNMPGQNNSFTFKKDWIIKSVSAEREFVSVSVSTDGYKVPVLFAQNDDATDGYDIYDANKMFGNGTVAEPYLVCEGTELCKEEVLSSSYTATMNIKSYESRSVEIVADNIPEEYSLTLIDGAVEVVMNQGDVYTTDIAEGENADRFKLLITKNNVSIADVAETESIRVVNNNRTISIYGGNDVRTEVYNALGQKVYETSDRVFDLNNVASGAYILKVSDGKTVNSAKIVVE